MSVFHSSLFLFGFASLYLHFFNPAFANASEIRVGLETFDSGVYFSLNEIVIRTSHRITDKLEGLRRIIKSSS